MRFKTFLLFVLVLPGISSFLPDEVFGGEKKGVTLIKQWRYMEGLDEEVLEVSAQGIHGKLTGAGLPKEGIEMEIKVAKIIPGPTQKSGVIVVGPDSTNSLPYQAIHWFDLGPEEVKLYVNPKVYPTVEAAALESKVDPKLSKTYRALNWGI